MTRRRALQVCPTPGCPKLTTGGKCPACIAASRTRRPTPSQAGYNSSAWRNASAAYLRDHPYCECTECTALPPLQRDRATEVHHIDGLGPLGPRGLDPDNFAALSKRHHSRETARDAFGH